jgi:hypothetical protein
MLAPVAVSSAGMAIFCGYGVALWLGAVYDNIVGTVPFLIFCKIFC